MVSAFHSPPWLSTPNSPHQPSPMIPRDYDVLYYVFALVDTNPLHTLFVSETSRYGQSPLEHAFHEIQSLAVDVTAIWVEKGNFVLHFYFWCCCAVAGDMMTCARYLIWSWTELLLASDVKARIGTRRVSAFQLLELVEMTRCAKTWEKYKTLHTYVPKALLLIQFS